jgi:putative transposase
LRKAVAQTKATASFHIDAWVVLPDHLHCLSTLPHGDLDFSLRWRAIKSAFSRKIPAGDYIHFNPVKHRFVANVADWPYSSFHRAVCNGIYPAGWGSSGHELDEAGEPWSG